MAIVHISSDGQFTSQLAAAGPDRLVVVDFFATWCGPCRMVAPAYEALANKYAGDDRIRFWKVDVDQCQQTASSEGIRAMPTFVIYRNKKQIVTIQGANIGEIESKISWELMGIPKVEAFSGSGHVLGAPSASTSSNQPAVHPLVARAARTQIWYQGDVGAAIQKSKADEKLVLVYIEGDDENSSQMTKLFDQSALEIQTKPIICLKLKAGSKDYRMFSQIYQVMIVPSTYIIGVDGVTLEILAQIPENSSQLMEKINGAVKLHNERMNKTSSGDQQSTTSDPQQASTSNSQNSNDIDKTERAQQLIRQARERKAREEEEREKERELERIRAGKGLQAIQRAKEEAEREQAAKERAKEKLEAKLARERVLKQIEEDRAARKKKDQAALEESKKASSSEKTKNLSTPSTSKSDSNESKIVFRLPDGEKLTHSFQADESLQSAVNFLRDSKGLTRFKISTAFPKHIYTDEELSESFRSNGLVPSAALLVLMSSGGASAEGSLIPKMNFDAVYNFFVLLFAPLLQIWTTVTSYLTGRGATGGGDTAPPATGAGPRSGGRPNADRFRRDGNVARLSGAGGEDDDDNNTWNGNSTQQM